MPTLERSPGSAVRAARRRFPHRSAQSPPSGGANDRCGMEGIPGGRLELDLCDARLFAYNRLISTLRLAPLSNRACHLSTRHEPGGRGKRLREAAAELEAAPYTDLNAAKRAESQRDSAIKPRVARNELLWEPGASTPLNLKEVAPTPRTIKPSRRDCGMAVFLLMAQLLRS